MSKKPEHFFFRCRRLSNFLENMQKLSVFFRSLCFGCWWGRRRCTGKKRIHEQKERVFFVSHCKQYRFADGVLLFDNELNRLIVL